jgi:hypothetical protein
MKTFTLDEIRELVPGEHHRAVNKWLARGDGIAVYQNHDLGSIDVGRRQFTSFGSPAAQLETDTPPQTLPDIGTKINWRYQLEGVYRGGAL